jgi:hypothetical protein
MANHPEFFNYAETIKNEQMWNDHEEWRHNTFLGKLTHSVMKFAHESEFFGAIADAFSDQENGASPYARTLSICLTISIIVVGVIGLYAIGSIIQMIIGREIVVEQQVLIETQVRLSDLMEQEENEKDDTGSIVDEDDNTSSNELEKNKSNRRNKKLKKNKKIQ